MPLTYKEQFGNDQIIFFYSEKTLKIIKSENAKIEIKKIKFN
jgi:hypothetical protein